MNSSFVFERFEVDDDEELDDLFLSIFVIVGSKEDSLVLSTSTSTSTSSCS